MHIVLFAKVEKHTFTVVHIVMMCESFFCNTKYGLYTKISLLLLLLQATTLTLH